MASVKATSPSTSRVGPSWLAAIVGDEESLAQECLARLASGSKLLDELCFNVGGRQWYTQVPDPENPVKTGQFDTVPYGGDDASMGGSWSNYPYFESGVVVVTSGREGLFLVRYRPRTVSE